MGPSGSGKSTLLHCLAGLDTLTSGRVQVGDVDLATLSDRERTLVRRDRLGFVFQSFNLLPTLTAEENITLPADLARRPVDRAWLGTIVGRLDLSARLRHRPSELSGGQQQRVAIGRALIGRPDLVLADEPTGALDSRSGTELLRFLRSVVDELGRTVVMVTHDPGAAAYADRVVFLVDGRVVERLDEPTRDGVLEVMGRLGGVAMLTLSLRNLVVNKLRLLLTVAAVTVGVSFVAGTFVLSDTMVKAFDELYDGLTEGTDVVVKSEPAYEADVAMTGGLTEPMDQSVLARVRDVPGVEVAEGAVAGYALVIDEDGAPVQPGGAPTLGVSVIEDDRLSGSIGVGEGRPPSGPDEVVVDARTVEKAGFELGDRVDVVLLDGRGTFELVGIVRFGETDSLLGATIAGFDLPTAQQVLDKEGLVDEVDVLAAPGVSSEELRDRVAAVLPEGVEAMTGDQVADDGTAAVRDSLGIFTTVLLVFAGVSLVVGSFVIWNAFTVLVAQRRREVALLRSVGATRRQVLGGVLTEAALVGLVAGALGLLVGIGLAAGIRALLTSIGLEVPSTSPAVAPRTVLVALAVGLVVTVLAAAAPAVRATRVSPMEALRTAVPAGGGIGRGRRVGGWVVTGVGLGTLAAAAWAGNHRWWTVVATLATFAALVTIGPDLAVGTARLADRGRWRMAARNVARSSRRSAATALALTIGMTVVVAVTVTSASLKESVAEAVSEGNRADLVLGPTGLGMGISPAATELVRELPEVDTVVAFRETVGLVQGEEGLVSAVDTDGLEQVIDLGIVTGEVSALGPGTVLVDADAAAEGGLDVGDLVTVTFADSGAVELEVVGTFTRGSLVNAAYLMAMPDFVHRVSTQKLDAAVFVTLADEVGPDEGMRSVESAVAELPNVDVNDPGALTREAQASVDRLLGIVTALLLLAVVVAVLGILNTLLLSVVERTREIGVLRAVGATRRQVRAVVRRESVLMALLGALTGAGLGVVSGIALSRALEDEGITTVAVPGARLVVYLGVAAAVGVLAAVGPARRASAIDILRAVATE